MTAATYMSIVTHYPAILMNFFRSCALLFMSGSLHTVVTTQYFTCSDDIITHHMTGTRLSCDYHVTHLYKPAEHQVKVCDYLPKLVSTEDEVDELHLLCVGEEVPVKEGQVGRDLTRRVLGERGRRLLILVWQRRLREAEGRGNYARLKNM